jgi:hypothetical protein
VKQSFSEDHIKFSPKNISDFDFHQTEYLVYHLDQPLGVVMLNSYSGIIVFTIDGENHDIPADRRTMMSMEKSAILDAIKSILIDIYNQAKNYLFEDKLKFTHRDPAIIGNGLHDYNVYHDSKLLGTLMFPTLYANAINQSISGSCIVFVVNGEVYNTGVTIEKVSNLSNREIFDIMRPSIIHIIEKNKISYK